jgi:hypothetical protein
MAFPGGMPTPGSGCERPARQPWTLGLQRLKRRRARLRRPSQRLIGQREARRQTVAHRADRQRSPFRQRSSSPAASSESAAETHHDTRAERRNVARAMETRWTPLPALPLRVEGGDGATRLTATWSPPPWPPSPRCAPASELGGTSTERSSRPRRGAPCRILWRDGEQALLPEGLAQ